jgi:2-(1,2-epoxy-1,2-dihydrophenyl)acetyl-CoA isomerase
VAPETIIYEKDKGVATITLNRPQSLNAFVPQMNQEVLEALRDGERDQEVRCFMITGAGRAFCAGQDLKGRTPEQKGSLGASLREKYNPMIRQIRRMEKIVIAAVNGVAAGAGVSLALACDLVYAAEEARFILAFVRIGLVPDSGATRTLVRALGRHRAARLIFTGEPLSAADARAAGLVAEVVPAAELQARVHEVAVALAAAPTRAIGLAKRLVNAAEDATLDDSMAVEASLQELAGRTEDHAEGVAAFTEKREPRFVGR